MFNYIWPIFLTVLSNTVYQICAKSVPSDLNPFASLTVTYLTAALTSLVFYFIFSKDANLIREYGKLNWASFVLGIAIVGLEVGFIYAYKAGWPVSMAQIVQAAFLAVILIFVGRFGYGEPLTWKKIAGIAICLAGLTLLNL